MNWEFSVGFYPGMLLGFRSYNEENKVFNNVKYLNSQIINKGVR